MSPRKLTEDDKHSMLQLYRNSKATTSTLAEEFGVSSSTVSRFLKNSLSSEEYETLIQQKRLARTPRGDRKSGSKAVRKKTADDAVDLKAQEKPSKKIVLPQKTAVAETDSNEDAAIASTSESLNQTETTKEKEVTLAETERESEATLQQIEPDTKLEIKVKPGEKAKPEIKFKTEEKRAAKSDDEEDDDDELDVITINAMLGEEIEDDEDEDEEDDDDDRDNDEDISYAYSDSQPRSLEILPLSAASLPRTCYLVVDRAAELIAKPLQEFADLGTIPDEEIQQKTLPVFDNHRIAKRFSHRREKVIKVPDGAILQKTAPYLHEKGITRLLIRGQIYAISES